MGWSKHESVPSNRLTWGLLAVVLGVCVWGIHHVTAHASQVITGLATYYTEASCRREGTSGVRTASGVPYSENALTAALPTRDFGTRWQVCAPTTGRCVQVVQTDFGPGKKARARGVVIDLTPAAFDALGGHRGCTHRGVCWGEMAVTVEPLS